MTEYTNGYEDIENVSYAGAVLKGLEPSIITKCLSLFKFRGGYYLHCQKQKGHSDRHEFLIEWNTEDAV